MVGGGGDVGEILESDQEEIVEESSHAGEAHLGQDQGGRTEDVHVSRIFHWDSIAAEAPTEWHWDRQILDFGLKKKISDMNRYISTVFQNKNALH